MTEISSGNDIIEPVSSIQGISKRFLWIVQETNLESTDEKYLGTEKSHRNIVN